MNIGEFIKTTLRNQGRSLTWLCDRLDANYKTLHGKLDFDRLKADDLLMIAHYLGIDLNELKSNYINGG
jgi:lambda repressor-like predicted transcriptional regulator